MLFPCSPDSLSVTTSRGSTGELCGQTQFQDSYLHNGGRGIMLEDASAQLEFCTNVADMVCGK